MKINRLEHTKRLYPHFYDKTNESNFTKHLKVVGNPQLDIRHKLKTIEWSRILEKPLQIWREQTEPNIYDMHFKVIMPYLKEINVYKNPIINANEEVVGFEKVDNPEDLDENGEQIGRAIHKTFEYEDRVRTYEKVLSNLQSNSMIPKDTYVLEIFTWDDYHFLKGYPENDYTVMEDNVLEWRYNETFLSITLEEISYSKYLTFRVHKDRIRKITIYKNENPFITHEFDVERIGSTKSTDFSYTYFDDAITNEETYLVGNFDSYYELEDEDANNVKRYYVDTGKDEYVFRLPLTSDDFDKNGIIKDTYDLKVTTFEKRHHCRQEYDKVYSKRYCGYDERLNDCFDHDYSLDMIGRLLNIHRFHFYHVYEEDEYHFSRTYPPYNDRATEDDYHYMKRIQYYISNYNHIVFPVLEFWKYYHTFTTIHSRKRIIGEMDYAYFNTNDDLICSDDIVVLDREFLDNNVDVEHYDVVVSLPNPSENTLDLLYVIYDDGKYDGYKTVKQEDDYVFIKVVDDIPYTLKEFDFEHLNEETITEYSINKATRSKGDGLQVTRGDKTWYEATVVNDVYVVPSTDYRLRYAIKDELNVEYLENNTGMVDYLFVNTLPTPSEQTLNKLYVVWDNYDGYVAYKTVSADENNDAILEYSFEKVVGNIPYINGNATIRLICYNRRGIELRTTPIIPTSTNDLTRNYTITTGYTYIDTPITIPSDTVSIKLVLESNNDFSFTDVSFERMTVVNFDNYYMTTDTDYNSNVYELHIDYDDLPANLRIGGDRFNILFNRSLPLTKKGYFLVDINEEADTLIEASTNTSIFLDNFLTIEQRNGEIGENNDYNETIDDYINPNSRYVLKYTAQSENITPAYDEGSFIPTITGDELVITTISYFKSDNTEIDVEEMKQKIYSDVESHITHRFTTPEETSYIIINISSQIDASISNIQLGRLEELSDEELYENSD